MKNKIVLTWTGGGGSSLSGKSVTCSPQSSYGTGSAGGFTMAEILLSLTIIGVVAAITLPSLTGNINERTWNTQRKALFARMSQALPLMDALNGFGTYKAASGTEGTTSYDAGTDNCAETFVTGGLSKVLKINNICDSEHLQDCGVPAKINPLGGGSAFDTPSTLEALNDKMVGNINDGQNNYSIYKTKAAAFETQNGESIVVYYNPTCTGSLGETSFTADSVAGGLRVQRRVCANFIYDLNGSKGPNTVGKDIGFMTVMYPFDAQLYSPYPATRPLSTKHSAIDDSGVSASKACTNYDSEYRLPRADELMSMFVNKKLIDGDSYETGMFGYVSSDFWVATIGKRVMSQNISDGFRDDLDPKWKGAVWCVKR
ncbi:MAG: type II secretion system GspH family protein [Fusobacterium sp.]|nr:type II secretion system GspH family protein [Fusobacterium sp.]